VLSVQDDELLPEKDDLGFTSYRRATPAGQQSHNKSPEPFWCKLTRLRGIDCLYNILDGDRGKTPVEALPLLLSSSAP
jgi:hypothetical protein